MEQPRPKILFLHSALGTSKDLEPLMLLLQERGFETLSFNFSGHGSSQAMPGQFRIDLFAQDLDQYFKKHGLKDVVIFGHSMGGYVALYHTANFEDSPTRMIFTYGTKFNWAEHTINKELTMLDPEHLLEKFPAHADMFKAKHGENWKNLMKNTAHMMQNLERLDGLTKEDLNDINIPVFLLLGDLDRLVSSEETLLTASRLHKSQVKTISHSKHEMDRANLREIANIMDENLR
ncbi:MAG TPA: alpha/beta hydrolase [Bacteriovoracaceae bacterium]|nr:alpha/beta hydrolase [Bacteriovoracaceae bacterium]